MFYMFVKMSSGWFGVKMTAICRADVMAFITNGEIVVFADDIEGFAEEIGIEVNDIKW